MDEAQSEPVRPTDPDMNWTGWALHTLRQAVEIDMRCKGLTERQQERSHLDPKATPDFGLIQARLTRSVRLSIALTERIRTGFMTRRDERKASGEEQRRRQRRERAAGMVAQAAAKPEEGLDADGLPATVGVTLVIGGEINPPEGEAPALWFLLTTHQVDDIADARRIIGFYRMRWTIEQLFRTMKTKGFDVEALRQEQDGPLEKLVTAILIAAIRVMQLVAERDGAANRPLSDVFDPDDQPALVRVCRTLEGKTAKQKNPHLEGSLAYAAWVFARLGGWTGYYGKPGPIVMLRGLHQFHAIKHGWTLRNV